MALQVGLCASIRLIHGAKQCTLIQQLCVEELVNSSQIKVGYSSPNPRDCKEGLQP
jgi:hypothetical protein